MAFIHIFVLILILYRQAQAADTNLGTASLCQEDTVIVNNFGDSLDGNCSLGHNTCNIRACISFAQGTSKFCLLEPGVHTISYGNVASRVSNSSIRLIGSTGNPIDTIIDGQSLTQQFFESNDASVSLYIQGITFQRFVYDTWTAAVLVIRGGSLYIENCIFSMNINWHCSSIYYESALIANSNSVGIYNSTFRENEATSDDWTNNSCNKYGTVCIFNNIRDPYTFAAPYELKNLSFENNDGCEGGEALAVHLGNYNGGNAYAGNGMQWYTNGHYDSIPCMTYQCGQVGFSFQFESPLTLGQGCQPTAFPTSVAHTILTIPLQDSTSCMKTANISGRLAAEVTDLVVSSDLDVVVEGRFQASNNIIANVLNTHLLKVRWFVGRSSYRQTAFLNSTDIQYPSSPNDMVLFRATFPNFFPASADFSGYLRTKVILTNWPLRKKAICLRWKRKA